MPNFEEEKKIECTSYDLIDWGQPFKKCTKNISEPSGTQVLVKVTAAGLCHSDLHIKKGYMDLGERGKLRFADRGAKLPMTFGHEIAGEVIAKGEKANNVHIGQSVLVFPWIGCGSCLACEELRESDCANMQIAGLKKDGGFATHVLLHTDQFLVDIDGLDPAEMVPHACSGITVYNALIKLGELRPGQWLAILGAGGLGLNAVAIASALGFQNIVVVDIDEQKLAAAKEMGATQVLNSQRGAAADGLRNITSGMLYGVVDTFGGESTAQLAINVLAKAGRYLIVGQAGGDFTMPIVWLPQRAMTVRGSHVGNSPQLRQIIDLVRSGKLKQMPIDRRSLSTINEAMTDLAAGNVTGRIVFQPD